MNWLKEPLLHFLLLGGLIFLFYSSTASTPVGEREIRLTRGQQQHLATTFSRTWQRPPTEAEFSGLVDDWIREEIAYREGQAMGLDTDDTIIRRRLRQKVELLAEDIVSLREPTEAELQDWLDVHAEDYADEPRYTLSHVYFSEDRRGDAAPADAEQALALLTAGEGRVDPETLGDPLPLPRRWENERAGALAAQMGGTFLAGIEDLDIGRWQGPVRSGFGLHLVRVESMLPGRQPSLEEARQRVLRDWESEQRRAAIDGMYRRLLENYTVVVEPLTTEGSAPSP